jgi:hypothetical protein
MRLMKLRNKKKLMYQPSDVSKISSTFCKMYTAEQRTVKEDMEIYFIPWYYWAC